MLSLRSRYNLRNKVRASRNIVYDGDVQVASPVLELPESNEVSPWADVPARGPQTRSNLGHRLSFDLGSGVIVLPEDDDWLGAEEESSGEDYGTETPLAGDDQGATTQEEDLSSSMVGPSSMPMSSSMRRHSTYYHHPERRRASAPLPLHG